MDIIAEEMAQIGAQQIMLPIMHPAEIWQRSGRLDTMSEIMFRLTDRTDAQVVLGNTNWPGRCSLSTAR